MPTDSVAESDAASLILAWFGLAPAVAGDIWPATTRFGVSGRFCVGCSRLGSRLGNSNNGRFGFLGGRIFGGCFTNSSACLLGIRRFSSLAGLSGGSFCYWSGAGFGRCWSDACICPCRSNRRCIGFNDLCELISLDDRLRRCWFCFWQSICVGAGIQRQRIVRRIGRGQNRCWRSLAACSRDRFWGLRLDWRCCRRVLCRSRRHFWCGHMGAVSWTSGLSRGRCFCLCAPSTWSCVGRGASLPSTGCSGRHRRRRRQNAIRSG